MKRKNLTKSEFQVMEHLWKMPAGGGFIGEILADYPDPKPAYTTLATFLKILATKGFVKSRLVGKMLWYTPLLTREEYIEQFLTHVKDTFSAVPSRRWCRSLPTARIWAKTRLTRFFPLSTRSRKVAP